MTKLIIVEGLPCSGKSTAAKFIAEKLGFTAVDEGTCAHPADFEFHAFLKSDELGSFSQEEQNIINKVAQHFSDGIIVPLGSFEGELFNRLLQHKVYDFLPWETEKPVMLEKWRSFAKTAGKGYVFNCVFLQNPMCETMMRFGFDEDASAAYINEIYSIIKPLSPVIAYLKTDSIAENIRAALSERGEEWLNAVIDYHCSGEYGKANGLSGFEGYISALEERQRREIRILEKLNIPHIIVDVNGSDRSNVCPDIISGLSRYI